MEVLRLERGQSRSVFGVRDARDAAVPAGQARPGYVSQRAALQRFGNNPDISRIAIDSCGRLHGRTVTQRERAQQRRTLIQLQLLAAGQRQAGPDRHHEAVSSLAGIFRLHPQRRGVRRILKR
ncbi:hypothetical protein D3C76_719290 [compost metagenome]